MRLNNSDLQPIDWEKVAAFAEWLLDVKNGNIRTPDESDPENTSWIDIPEEFQTSPPLPSSPSSITDPPDLSPHHKQHQNHHHLVTFTTPPPPRHPHRGSAAMPQLTPPLSLRRRHPNTTSPPSLSRHHPHRNHLHHHATTTFIPPQPLSPPRHQPLLGLWEEVMGEEWGVVEGGGKWRNGGFGDWREALCCAQCFKCRGDREGSTIWGFYNFGPYG
nr:DNA helicase [Tanacetum cinerariifolium]